MRLPKAGGLACADVHWCTARERALCTRHHPPRWGQCRKWEWAVHHPAFFVGRAVEGARSSSCFRMSGVDLGWFRMCRCSLPPSFLHQCVGLGSALSRVVAGGRGVMGGGRQVPEITDFAMLPALNDRCSPVRGSPAPIDGSMCSPTHGHHNVSVGAANGGPRSPCGLLLVGVSVSTVQTWQLRRGGPLSALLLPLGAWVVLIWSADGACVLKAWGEPPWAREAGTCWRMLACVCVAWVCVCPVHTNAKVVHSMARHELWTWCTGHTQVPCAGASTVQGTSACPLEERQLLARLECAGWPKQWGHLPPAMGHCFFSFARLQDRASPLVNSSSRRWSSLRYTKQHSYMPAAAAMGVGKDCASATPPSSFPPITGQPRRLGRRERATLCCAACSSPWKSTPWAKWWTYTSCSKACSSTRGRCCSCAASRSSSWWVLWGKGV